MVLNREDLDVVPVVEYREEAVSAQVQQQEIGLNFSWEGNSVPISADRQHIERVVINLLSNLIK